ncbi:MAG: ATP phosphoribosyltransferase regulatory subunit [Pseudomonadales bacterium]|nr:ATP phosphoribosyltransferase regulatory subunit [Pseudomonadales bacterium]
MSVADRWLLPDGIDELLPVEAEKLESLRRQLLDRYRCWGYQLVIPPLVEFTESLLISSHRDLDIQTFKVTDQLSGRLMGIRADITPQTARIDAHSLNEAGPARLCYAGTVLRTRPKTALSSRAPIQIGAECYGINELAADKEVICLMLETLALAGVTSPLLSIGDVSIFRALASLCGLDEEQENRLLDILQRKAKTELTRFIDQEINDKTYSHLLEKLITLFGDNNARQDNSVIEQARTILADAPLSVQVAIDNIEQVILYIQQRFPNVQCYVDFAELPGYHYHSGLVFAAYAPGYGEAVANGGRYDDIGAVFGRARPATGFNANLKALIDMGEVSTAKTAAILTRDDGTIEQWQAIQSLRNQGETVVFLLGDEDIGSEKSVFDRELVKVNGSYTCQPINHEK